MLEISEASLGAVEFGSLRKVVADFATTDIGRIRLLKLLPAESEEKLDERRARFGAAQLLLVDGPLLQGFASDLEPLLARVADPRAILDGADVLQAADLLRAANQLRKRLAAGDSAEVGALRELVDNLPETGEWTQKVGRVLDRRGRVKDDASALLKSVRQKVQKTRGEVYRQLQKTVADHGEHLSEETVPLHEGRLVVLLKSGAKGQIKGLVHGRSGRGRSFYFEPFGVVETNNQLRESLDAEAAERARLLEDLIDGLRAITSAVEETAAVLAEVDVQQAACRFAEAVGARLAAQAVPGVLRLVGARHPLLDPSLSEARRRALDTPGHMGAVVPLEIEFGEERRLMVVTGPNAGGKTVALKTVGLLALMHLSGLPVPAEKGTRLPWLESIVATVGDEQDLLQERSTFSARLLRLNEAWEAAGPGGLVLLDELGSGTDPDEGAALAAALLEHLHEHQGLTLVTTHLTRLAALALEASGATCAAMEFDPAAGEPTYQLLPGTPGASEALSLASRLGLPKKWLERAAAELDPEQRKLQQLLTEVEKTRLELTRRISEVDSEASILVERNLEVDQRLDELKIKHREVARRLESELSEFKRGVRERLRRAEAQLKADFATAGTSKPGSSKRGSSRPTKKVERISAEVLEGEPESLNPEPEEGLSGPLVVGGPVRHRGLGWEGELKSLQRGRAEVIVRGKRMRCTEDELVGLVSPAKVKKEVKVISRPTSSLAQGEASSESELQLIGQRVEEALEALDRHLDQALLAGLAEVRVVHGHGSGRLRKAVREHLGGHRAVLRFAAASKEQGGDGATQVQLQG